MNQDNRNISGTAYLTHFRHSQNFIWTYLSGAFGWSAFYCKDRLNHRSFCLCHVCRNGLSYLGEETWPTLCKSDGKQRFGVRDLEWNKHQLLHRIQSVWHSLIYNNLAFRQNFNPFFFGGGSKVLSSTALSKSKMFNFFILSLLARDDIVAAALMILTKFATFWRSFFNILKL